ncbi:MAG: hypothetical protein QM682_11295 [Paracoccus sp. (in: a-proteobacteria)]|uniref:hypothetical protein n=1 Tax=Paracoccus sp. TaxID=267 RepID=UPI0039E57F2B
MLEQVEEALGGRIVMTVAASRRRPGSGRGPLDCHARHDRKPSNPSAPGKDADRPYGLAQVMIRANADSDIIVPEPNQYEPA